MFKLPRPLGSRIVLPRLQHRHVTGSIYLLLVVLHGCNDFRHSADHITAPAVSATALESADRYDRVRSAEALLGRMANAAPSFAGLYLEGRALVALTTDESAREHVRALVGAELEALRASMPEISNRAQDILLRDADFTFRELNRWRNLALESVFHVEDVRAIDLDERDNRVVIELATGTGLEELQGVLSSLPLPAAAIKTEVTGLAVPGRLDTTLLFRSRPLRGGFQVEVINSGWDPECTLGPQAKKSGQNLVLTNSHCTSSLFDATPPDSAFQSNDAGGSSSYVGHEAIDPPPIPFECYWSILPCRWTDVVAFVNTTGDAGYGLLAKTEALSWSAHVGGTLQVEQGVSFAIVGTNDWPLAGLDVDKVGRTSGWTRGELVDTCEVKLLEDSTHGKYHVLCANEVYYRSSAGDSGAPVFDVITGNQVTLLGVHFADNGDDTRGYFSPLGSIEDDFGAMSYHPPPLSVSVSAQDTGDPYSWVTATAVVQNGFSPYTYSWKINGSPACGNQSTCQGQLGGAGMFTTFRVTVTDAASDQDIAQKSVQAESDGGGGGCPDCPLLSAPDSSAQATGRSK